MTKKTIIIIAIVAVIGIAVFMLFFYKGTAYKRKYIINWSNAQALNTAELKAKVTEAVGKMTKEEIEDVYNYILQVEAGNANVDSSLTVRLLSIAAKYSITL